MTLIRHPTDGRVHFSEIKAFARSARHYVAACREAKTITRPMIVGAVADGIVFGDRGYAIYDGRRAGKEWDAYRAAHAGETICIQSEYDDAFAAATSVIRDPVAQALLFADGRHYQQTAQWSAYGLECAAGIAGERGGFDLTGSVTPLIASFVDDVAIGDRFVADLKITSTTEPHALETHAYRMLWHAQLAWYVDGLHAIDQSVKHAFLICAEAGQPHNVTVLHVPTDMLDEGRRAIAAWAEQLRACDQTGVFPGYVRRAVKMGKPYWAESAAEIEE